MTAQTTSQAVATRDQSPAAMIDRYRGDFATVLPSHIKPETWVRVAQGALRRNEDLLRAAQSDPASLMSALLEAARQGLEPGTEQYYLTPRKVKGQWQVLGITGYQGEIELMYRAGAISSVVAEVVYDGDVFRYQPGRDLIPHHEIDWDAPERGALRLVYAFARMKDGSVSKVVVLNRRQIDAIKATSQGSDSPYSPWQKWEEAMWLKSAVHQLAKWVPTSAEYIREQLRAVRDVQAEQPQPAAALPTGRAVPASPQPRADTTTGEIHDEPVDAELVDDGPSHDAVRQAAAGDWADAEPQDVEEPEGWR